jgi:hypothetical protein
MLMMVIQAMEMKIQPPVVKPIGLSDNPCAAAWNKAIMASPKV